MNKKADYPDQFSRSISDLFNSHCVRLVTPDTSTCHETSDLDNRENKFVSLQVRGNSSLLVTENQCLVVDPDDQIMDLIEDAEIDYAFISHGHYDHHTGLNKLFKNGQRPTIVCSRFTRKILWNSHVEQNEMIHAFDRAIVVDPNPFEDVKIGDFEVRACNGGHCLGNTMYFVREREGSHSILFAQESTLRLVGGNNANLPKESNCEVLVVDGNCCKGSTSDVPYENHKQLLRLLQTSFLTHQAVVILCNSLGIMQEVYTGVSASLFSGELAGKQVRLMNCPPVIRDELVKLTSSPTEIFPWDAQISFEDWTTQELLRYGKDAVVIVPAAIGDDGCATVDIHEFLKQKSLKVLAVNLNLPDLQEFDNFDNVAIPTHSSATEVDQLINHCNPNKVIFGCTGGTELSLQKKWPAVDFYNGVTKTATLHFNNANDCIEG